MHERFRFHNLEELEQAIAESGAAVSLQRDLAPLRQPVRIYGQQTPNSLGIHPMEGCDGTADGRPDELTFRRYERFARGGAGLLWFEATAVAWNGRANPRQLWASPDNTGALAQLLEKARRAAREMYGPHYEFVSVIQLTHSGRYSKPDGKGRPIIAQHNPYLDPKVGIDESYPVIRDDELEQLEDAYVAAAKVAAAAGFTILDIKSCHRYLVSELLGSHLRPGRYGGSFANRTRFLLNIIDKIHSELGRKVDLAVRLNAWDGLPFPYGWGVHPDSAGEEPGPLPVDLSEPRLLLGELVKRGVQLVSVSLANPYYNPHFNRPYDLPSQGLNPPEEHPLAGVSRIFNLTRELQAAYPDLTIMGTGYSWFRQFLGNAAAANLSRGIGKIVGVGREAFAYPDFARDLLDKGALDPNQVCLACSKCTDIMRNGGKTGCVLRDKDVYLPIYQEGLRKP